MDSFNAVEVKNNIVAWIKEWFEQNGKGCNAVIGISGGTDSSVVAALCVKALGKDRVIGVLMPNGEQKDIDTAKKLVNCLCIKSFVVDISAAVNGTLSSINTGTLLSDSACIDHPITSIYISEQTKINLPPRIRMATLYAISQSVNGRVANTCNLSEDYVGYSTRYGDSVGDFSPLSDLTKTEVKAIGRALGLPDELVDKTPSDGLCGQTDEEKLGFTYDELDKYIREGVIENIEHQALIEELHNKNLFKLQFMPKFEYPLGLL